MLKIVVICVPYHVESVCHQSKRADPYTDAQFQYQEDHVDYQHHRDARRF